MGAADRPAVNCGSRFNKNAAIRLALGRPDRRLSGEVEQNEPDCGTLSAT